MKKLSICIPTYNRSKLLDRLLNSIPSSNDIMVSICDDGSIDDTYEIVKNHQSRISITYVYQENRGRAAALRKSILNSNAEFVVMVDSDDYFERNGIKIILEYINNNLSENFFVFPIKILKNSKYINNTIKGIPKINYISLRSDYRVKNDLQEVLRQKLLLDILYDDPGEIKRIPTSYLLFKASEKVNCFPVDSLPVKIKEYLGDGMSSNILFLKVKYPKYIAKTYKIALNNSQYKSKIYKFKYTILFYRYSFHDKTLKLLKLRDFPLFLIGCVYGLFDLLKLSIFIER